jgi:hypothetical protein
VVGAVASEGEAALFGRTAHVQAVVSDGADGADESDLAPWGAVGRRAVAEGENQPRKSAKCTERRSPNPGDNRGTRGIRGKKTGQARDSAYSACSAVPSLCEASSQPASKLGYCNAEMKLAFALLAPFRGCLFGSVSAALDLWTAKVSLEPRSGLTGRGAGADSEHEHGRRAGTDAGLGTLPRAWVLPGNLRETMP